MERVARPLLQIFGEYKVQLAGRYDYREFADTRSRCWKAGSWTMAGIKLMLVEDKRKWAPELAKFYPGLGGSLVHQDFYGYYAEDAAEYVLQSVHDILHGWLKSLTALSRTCRALRTSPPRPTIELGLVQRRLDWLKERRLLDCMEPEVREFGPWHLRVYGMDPQQEHLALLDEPCGEEEEDEDRFPPIVREEEDELGMEEDMEEDMEEEPLDEDDLVDDL
jgi:hypothetical protein